MGERRARSDTRGALGREAGPVPAPVPASTTPWRRELKALVAARGLSLRSLATRVGVHHSTLSRLLAGRVTPSPRLLAALAAELGIEADGLAALAGAPPAGEEAVAWTLPPHVGPAEFRATLERLATMAGGAEVEGLVRAGFGPKRAVLGQTGMAGPALARLDALYDLYVGRDGQRLPTGLRRRVAGALLYFVLSVDGIPDDLFPVGYLDDAWVVDLVWREVEAYRRLAPDAGGGSA
jgi:transcriptional regulator with XRE-family HTH domain